MPHRMFPTTEDIISYILNWVCPECGDQWANVLKSSRVKGNVERTGVMFGSVRLRQPDHNISTLRTRTAVKFKMTPGSRRTLLALHRMPLRQSVGRSVLANAGNKEEFL
jgi:hypothetical protein